MSHVHQPLATAETYVPDTGSAHRYENVNISGNGNNFLGNIYHFHSSAPRSHVAEARSLQDTLDQLSYPEMFSRFESLNEPYPKTFNWTLGSTDSDEIDSNHAEVHEEITPWDSFSNWLKTGADPYWVSGKLGTGKSILMKYLVEHLSPQSNSDRKNNHIVISHFFWQTGSELQKSVAGCLRSLLWQLLKLGATDNKTRNTSMSNYRSSRGLQKGLIDAIGQTSRTIFIVLDGLDECEETNEVLNLVDKLAALQNIKLCVSSRPEEAFVLNLSDFPKLKLQDLNKQDIAHVVRTELLDNPRVQKSKSWNLEDAQDLANSIINKAEGVFLWVMLVIKDLIRGWTNRDDLKQMKDRLEKLPNDVYKLYTELISRGSEDHSVYLADAAFYCKLLGESLGQMLPLLSFHFAINDDLRAQFLEFETTFCKPTEELTAQMDCKLTATWINARTGGLLEVVERASIDPPYYYKHSVDYRHMPFHGQVVEFVHRSAYTYICDTTDGQELMLHSAISPKQLATVYFQSQLITQIIEPVIHGVDLVPPHPMGILFPVATVLPNIYQDCYKLLRRLCNHLCARGLICTTDKGWTLGTGAYLYWPTSKYSKVDIVPVLLQYDHPDIAKCVLDDYNCVGDDEYMTDIILTSLENSRNSREHIHRLLGELSTRVEALHRIRLTESKEQVCPLSRLAVLAADAWHKERSTATCQFMQEHQLDLDLHLLPLSGDMLRYTLNAITIPSTPYLYAAPSIKTMQALGTAHDSPRDSSTGLAICFYDPWSKSSTHRAISSEDSRTVFQLLRLYRRDDPNEAAEDPESACHWLFEAFGLVVHLPANSALFKALQPIFDRSRFLESGVELLRHTGKSEETIEYTVDEVLNLTRHGIIGLKPTNKVFHRLLGSEPETLRSWCQKFPDIRRFLEQENQREKRYH